MFPPAQSTKLKRINRLKMSKTAHFDTFFILKPSTCTYMYMVAGYSQRGGPNAPLPPPLNLACTCHGSNSRRLRDFGHMLPNSTLILLSLSLPHAASAQSSLSQLTTSMMMTFTSHVATRVI